MTNKPNAAQKLAADLAVLARAATPGPWVTDGDFVNEHGNVLRSYIANGRRAGGRIAEAFANCLVKTEEQCQANAAFIAGANPKAVLLLIDEIHRLDEDASMRAVRSLRADCKDLLVERNYLAGLLKRFVDGEHDQDENQAERHMYHDEAQNLLAYLGGEVQGHTILPDDVLRAQHEQIQKLTAENEVLLKNATQNANEQNVPRHDGGD